jgi:hypothetical protein
MSTHVFAPSDGRLLNLAWRRAAICVLFLAGPSLAHATDGARPGKVYYFATRDACITSGAFTSRECVTAFVNARAQLLDRAPRFSSIGDCKARFHLCEAVGGESWSAGEAEPDETAFAPAALGVEIVVTTHGAESAPTLATETPTRLFSYFPVSREYDGGARAERPEQQIPGILAADRFEPFSKRKPVQGTLAFTASALGTIEGAAPDTSASETPEARRSRLKSAPFIH